HRTACAGLAPAVLAVAGDRIAERGEMDADLVSATGVEVTAQQRMGWLPVDDLVPRASKPPARDHGHALALPRMTADRPLELSGLVAHAAAHDREIGPAQRTVAELRRQRAVASAVPGDHDQPGGSSVESMPHPPPPRAAHRRPCSTPAEER